MTQITRELNAAFLRPLREAATSHSDLADKPFLLDLAPPFPPRLRVYLYSLVGGHGERSRREYKVVLRTRRHAVGDYGHFDHDGGRFTMVVGYERDLDVFVLWDASLHPRFKNGGNLQVRDTTIRTASALGVAEQTRTLTTGVREVVLACQSPALVRAIDARVVSTGGLREGEWVTFLS